jgi:hypothetical protein
MNEKRLLVEVQTFRADPSMLRESLSSPNSPFKVKGILQRAGVKNQNGRIYPKEILLREAQKYTDTFVRERRALGELDHPECISSCDIMTYEGWRDIKTVKVGDIIPTLNTITNTLEYHPIERVIYEPYKGKMISITGKNIDLLVTPNHRFILNDRNGRFLEKTAQEIFEISKTNKNPHLSIPTVSDNWIGNNTDFFIIPSNNTDIAPLKLNAKAWFSFLGFYLAEGHCTNRVSTKNYGIFITQNKGEISDEFRKILQELSPELKWNEWSKGDDAIIFNTHDIRLWTYLSNLGDKYTKYIPQDIKNASPELLQNLYDWYLNGDRSVVGEFERTSIFSVSKKLMEDFYEVILKLGMTGVIKEQISTKDYMFAGRIIEAKNKVPLYRLWVKTSKAIHLDFRFIKIEEVDYDGTVHCVTVKNGTFYCRNQNKCLWSGNSSVINLKNVSHNITEIHWDGDDLIGTCEILSTPSGNILKELFRGNINVGISSRALGSLNKISENSSMVGDDLEIICWDFVSNPSVAGSFMFMDQTNPMMESVQRVQNPVTNKWESVNKIVRDILSEIN